MGEGIGLEYSYHEKRFVEFNFSLVGVVNHPLPVPFDIEGEYSTIYTQYFSLTNNFQKKRFTFGYGINYSKNTFSEGYRSLTVSIPSTGFSISNKTIGVTLNSYYQLGKAFNIGLIYRPTYFRKNEFVDNQLEHLVSLELLWRIRLNKK